MDFFRSMWIARGTLAGMGAIGLFWGTLVACAPQIQARLDLDDRGFGAMFFVASGGAVVAMWLAPQIDAWLGRRATGLAAVGLALAAAPVGWAATPAAFVAAAVAFGFVTGLLDVLANARIGDLEAASGRSLMSLNHAGYSFVYAGAAAATGVARQAGLPLEAIFAAAALVLAPAALGVLRARFPAAERGGGPGAARLNAAVWLLGFVCLIAFFAENAAEVWSALHIERTLGGNPAEGALGPATLGLTMGIGRLLGHLATPVGGEVRVLGAGGVMAATGMALAAGAPAPWVAYAGFGLLGLGVSVMAPLALALAARWAPPGTRTLAVSRAAFVGYFGFFLGPPFLGLLSDALGLRAALAVGAALLLTAPLVLLPILVRRRPAAA